MNRQAQAENRHKRHYAYCARQTDGIAPNRKEAITLSDRCSGADDRTTGRQTPPIGSRDHAFCFLDFAGALRRSERVALDFSDFKWVGPVRLRIRSIETGSGASSGQDHFETRQPVVYSLPIKASQ